MASRTTSSPISPQPQQNNISLDSKNSGNGNSPATQQPVSKVTSSTNNSSTVKKPPTITQNSQNSKDSDHKNNNNNSKIRDIDAAVVDSSHVPIIEVSLETPSATSTPNLNSKKNSVPPLSAKNSDASSINDPIENNLTTNNIEQVKSTSPNTPDLVVNKNFINEAVTGSRYWTNQALQNDNSTKISQVVRAAFFQHNFFPMQ